MTNESTPHNKPNETTTELRGIILDEQSVLTLAEISNACAVQTEYIIELVDEGLITPELSPEITPEAGPQFSPETREPHSWRFTGMHLRLVRIASHLQSDLGVNLAGVGLALQLLDEVEALRARLNAVGTTGAIGSS